MTEHLSIELEEEIVDLSVRRDELDIRRRKSEVRYSAIKAFGYSP